MYKIIVKGIVQGVGFRPFVYRTAKKNALRGYVRNAANSVEILIDGKKQNIKRFLKMLENEHPPLAEIFSIDAKQAESQERYDDFYVLKSESKGETDSVIPPDVCVCEKCYREIFDKRSRRYLYPFTVCTDCGPRFTIIEGLPYDRERTTMLEFPMCEECEREYTDALNRRFRAEPICCSKCGPQYELFRDSEKISQIQKAAEALDSGRIVAIKGVGGTHLATKTTEDEAILKIRKILHRPQKPFAIMARNVRSAEKITYIDEKEKELLTSFRRPIVLLKKKENKLSEYIAPQLHNVGVMLPYAGIHHLLFHYSREPAFVMTSANVPGEPMTIKNKEILTLNAEYSLLHNRRIKNRCDDSVIKFVDGKLTFLRRSRGFVPMPIFLNVENFERNSKILALGAELDVTACILKGKNAFISQYIGNTTKLKTLEYLEAAIYNLMELTKVEKIGAVAVDMHPSFNTVHLGVELSKKFKAKLIKCQHHHAHIASLMAESGVGKIIGIACDGVGYGSDGKVWGGEILVGGFNGFERAGSLMPQIMPGGDLATTYPARMVAGVLSKKYSLQELKKILIEISHGFRSEKEIDIVLKQIEQKYNTPETTSTGRVLDAISALLSICYERTYEGEPAMKLEAFAFKGRAIEMPVIIRKYEGRYVLDTTEILDAVLQMKEKFKSEHIAASAQKAIACGLAEIAVKVAKEEKIDTVGFSGGVAYNGAIVRYIRKKIEKKGLKFLTQTKVPCGDGGISLGQAVIAAGRLNG